jgi:hypothetical protein
MQLSQSNRTRLRVRANETIHETLMKSDRLVSGIE